MSKILSAEEKKERQRENQRSAEVTYKIMAPSLVKLETCINHLREFHGSKNVSISSIMKNLGEDGFHCFVNVLPSKEEAQ